MPASSGARSRVTASPIQVDEDPHHPHDQHKPGEREDGAEPPVGRAVVALDPELEALPGDERGEETSEHEHGPEEGRRIAQEVGLQERQRLDEENRRGPDDERRALGEPEALAPHALRDPAVERRVQAPQLPERPAIRHQCLQRPRLGLRRREASRHVARAQPLEVVLELTKDAHPLRDRRRQVPLHRAQDREERAGGGGAHAGARPGPRRSCMRRETISCMRPVSPWR